jgi:hypothetical protein
MLSLAYRINKDVALCYGFGAHHRKHILAREKNKNRVDYSLANFEDYDALRSSRV